MGVVRRWERPRLPTPSSLARPGHNIKQVLTRLDVPYTEKLRFGCSTPRPKGATPPWPATGGSKLTAAATAKVAFGSPSAVVVLGGLGVVIVAAALKTRARGRITAAAPQL